MTRRIFTDVDLDVADRDLVIKKLETVSARINRPGGYERHPSGVYFQNISRNPFDSVATVDYKKAELLGYFKVDFLNVSLYQQVRSDEHLTSLMEKEPDWELFTDKSITEKLFHLQGRSELLCRYKPKSVEDLAILLAIIRPAKAYLQKAPWEKIKAEVWDKTLDRAEYSFKRSHSIAYALTIVVNLNLLTEQQEEEKDPIKRYLRG